MYIVLYYYLFINLLKIVNSFSDKVSYFNNFILGLYGEGKAVLIVKLLHHFFSIQVKHRFCNLMHQ